MATSLVAHSVAEVEALLADLREQNQAGLRTSSLTHMAWVPPEWESHVRDVMATLGERHPSRLLLLFPVPDSGEDGFEARPSIATFRAGATQLVYGEVIDVRLHGTAARAPASVVLPLLVPDLPAFLRWRGQPPFEDPVFCQLIDIADRLIVDSSEWSDVPGAYGPLSELFGDTLAATDIAWARARPWRGRLAMLWADIAELKHLRVRGPLAETVLTHGWLSARLEREIALEHEDAQEIEAIEVDGEPIQQPRWSRNTPADLLSDQLDIFGRDRIYEEAVRAAASA